MDTANRATSQQKIKPVVVNDEKVRFNRLLQVIAVLFTFDVTFTAYGILSGVAREVNPFFNWIDNPITMIGFMVLVKCVVLIMFYLIGTTIFGNFRKHSRKYLLGLNGFVIATTLLMTGMVIGNIWILATPERLFILGTVLAIAAIPVVIYIYTNYVRRIWI